jgi:hypothetical protein
MTGLEYTHLPPDDLHEKGVVPIMVSAFGVYQEKVLQQRYADCKVEALKPCLIITPPSSQVVVRSFTPEELGL